MDSGEMIVTIPDTQRLPRRWKKLWRKLMDGRFLTHREWAIASMLASRRRARVKYVRFPVSLRLIRRSAT